MASSYEKKTPESIRIVPQLGQVIHPMTYRTANLIPYGSTPRYGHLFVGNFLLSTPILRCSHDFRHTKHILKHILYTCLCIPVWYPIISPEFQKDNTTHCVCVYILLNKYIYMYIYMWIKYSHSLTWNKVISVWFPSLTMIQVTLRRVRSLQFCPAYQPFEGC